MTDREIDTFRARFRDSLRVTRTSRLISLMTDVSEIYDIARAAVEYDATWSPDSTFLISLLSDVAAELDRRIPVPA